MFQPAALVFSALVSLQATEAPHFSTQETYSPPRIRPFEPPSDFAIRLGEPEGDAAVDPTLFTRRSLLGPVAVENYAGQYEAMPTDVEAAYSQGVNQAELEMDGGMGPLDGLWRIEDEAGRHVLTLALTDPGGDGVVEGGWLNPGAPPAQDRGGVGAIVRSGSGALIPTGVGRLSVQWAAEAWRGVLTAPDGSETAVVMSRPL